MFDSIYNNHHCPLDDDNNHFLSNFPSHLLDDDEPFMDTILPYHPPPPPPQPLPPHPPPLLTTNMGLNSDEISELPRMMKKKKQQDGGGSSSRRKAGKKDRHSKIFTAHGPRDRRMRLSLQIARKFFDLQDMLGFDKASKTIEWLFNKSRAAIKDLADKSCTAIIPQVNSEDDVSGKNKEKLLLSERKSTKEGIYKMNEKRKEARARARERTKEKLTLKNKEILEMEKNPNNNGLEHNVVRVVEVHQQLEDQMASVGIIEKFLAASSSMADFGHDCQGSAFSMEFPRNRAMESSRINEGLLQELVVNFEYNQVDQDPSCTFMDMTYNSSRDFNY